MEPDSRPCSSARTHLASIEFLRVRHQWVKLANCDKRLITGARSSYSAVWNMLSIRTPAPLTESQWAAVRATLPTGTDEAWFRSELNRIASDTVPPNKRQWIHLKRAQACGDLIRELPYLEHIKDKDALAEQLKRHQQEENNRANELRRIAAQKQPKLLQYFFLLDLWERAGGKLGITTPYKKRGDRHSPLPTGPVIRYFQAVATAIWGRAPRAHRIKKIKRQYRRGFKRGCSDIASISHVGVVE
jgi:hypothetical protein